MYHSDQRLEKLLLEDENKMTQNDMPDEIYLYKHFTNVSPVKSTFVVELYAAQYDKSEGVKYIRADLAQTLAPDGGSLDDANYCANGCHAPCGYVDVCARCGKDLKVWEGLAALDKLLSGIKPLLRSEKELADIIRAALTAKQCQHELIDIRNEVIESGYMCLKCRELFSAADQKKPKQSVNKQLVEALKEASSALSSLNYKGTTPFIRDGGTFYGQTDEWCEWVETEILPVVRQALAAAEKEGV